MILRTLTLLFLGLQLNSFAGTAILRDTAMYGTWVNLGYSFEGSFYPSNAWNQETIALNADYTFVKSVATISNHRIVTETAQGKWSLNDNNKKLRFYYDNERYSSQGKILMYDSELNLDFFSSSYFTITVNKGGKPVTVLFQKSGVTETFEENFERVKSAVPEDTNQYASYFHLVNSLKPTKKKKIYFEENFFNIYLEETKLDAETTSKTFFYETRLTGFSDTAVSFELQSEYIDIEYKNGKTSNINNSYGFDYENKADIQKNIPIPNLNSVTYRPVNEPIKNTATVTMILSGITTLILAPLISINYKTGDFNQKRYYTTAGIGLIGIGVSVPVAIIFTPRKISLTTPDGAKGKKKWYLEKVKLQRP